MVSQTKIKVSTFAEFCGYFQIGKDLPSFPKSAFLHSALLLIGLFSLKNKSEIESWLWFCDSGQGHWRISWSLAIPFYDLSGLNRKNESILHKTMKTRFSFVAILLSRKGKRQSQFAAKWKRTRVFKQPSPELNGISHLCEDHTWSSNWMCFLLFLLVV